MIIVLQSAFAVASFFLTLIASYQVLGTWFTVGLVAALLVFGALLGMLSNLHMSQRKAACLFIAGGAVSLAINIGATVLMWIAFGPATTLFITIGFYACLAWNYISNVRSAKPRGATTTWI